MENNLNFLIGFLLGIFLTLSYWLVDSISERRRLSRQKEREG